MDMFPVTVIRICLISETVSQLRYVFVEYRPAECRNRSRGQLHQCIATLRVLVQTELGH